jgi:hypothetical protein
LPYNQLRNGDGENRFQGNNNAAKGQEHENKDDGADGANHDVKVLKEEC